MEERCLDYVLVPLGMLILLSYYVCHFYTLLRNPSNTVIGLNAQARYQWVLSMMAVSYLSLSLSLDPLKNGILAIQTIRNNMMASSLLATIAITLSSLIGVYTSSESSSDLVYGNKDSLSSSIKRLSISICFLIAFLCNVQSTRYYAQASFLITAPALKGKREFIEYVAKTLNRGSYSWSLGLRAFYLSFPLVLWIYGPIPMFVCSCFTAFILYFLDTPTKITQDLHTKSFKEKEPEDMESV